MKDERTDAAEDGPRHEASEITQTRPVPPGNASRYREGDNEVVEQPFVYEGREDRDPWSGKPVDRDGEVFSGDDLRTDEETRDLWGTAENDEK
jgi:hypothetical protein